MFGLTGWGFIHICVKCATNICIKSFQIFAFGTLSFYERFWIYLEIYLDNKVPVV